MSSLHVGFLETTIKIRRKEIKIKKQLRAEMFMATHRVLLYGKPTDVKSKPMIALYFTMGKGINYYISKYIAEKIFTHFTPQRVRIRYYYYTNYATTFIPGKCISPGKDGKEITGVERLNQYLKGMAEYIKKSCPNTTFQLNDNWDYEKLYMLMVTKKVL